MTSPDGVPVNAVYGFTNMLARLLREHVGTHLAVIFDAGRQTFRSEIYPQYKAHRPEPPEDLRPQFSLIRDATRAFNVPAIELAGWEADDLIASYATAVREMGHLHHRLVRQGPDAADRPRRVHAGADEADRHQHTGSGSQVWRHTR